MHKDAALKAYKRKIHRRALLVLSIVLLFVVNMAGLFAGTLFYNEFCVLNTRTSLQRFNPLKAKLERGLQTKSWQSVELTSSFGYDLKGTYLPNATPSDNTVILVHGIAANRLMGLWYVNIYLDAGYNVLIYDSRAHGESGGNSVTWGYYEKYDLDQWVHWVAKEHPKGIIGVHGISMGAATAFMHAELNESLKQVHFYVADSPYSDLEELLTLQIGTIVNSHNPIWIKFLLKYSSAVAYIQSRFRYDEVSPIHSVQTVTTPILYIHGEADAIIPSSMSLQLYNATKGYREIHTFPRVGHVMAIFDRKTEYSDIVHQFIQTVSKQ
jgi:fermentation-respiration switch protein FrsA (DUF1100 family)